MLKETSKTENIKTLWCIPKEEYEFHVVHFVQRITDETIYIDRIDNEPIKRRYLFEYLNTLGQDGWRLNNESRHESIIYMQKKVGERVQYEYQIIHCIAQHADGPILVQRVNEHKLSNRCLLVEYLNKMGKKGFRLRGEVKHQFCNIIERTRY